MSCDFELKKLKINKEKYRNIAIGVSIFIGVIGLFGGIPIGLLSFAGTLAVFMMYPKIELSKRTAEVESKLPFELRTMGLRLLLGVPFSKAVINIEDYPSLIIKRAKTQMLNCFETGSDGKELLRIAEDLIDREKFKLKEYSSKSAIFGLLLIITNAVLPTFFLIYVSAGTFSGGTFQNIELVMYLFFPLISVAILIVSIISLPKNAFSEKKINWLIFFPSLIVIVSFMVNLSFLSLFALPAGAYIIFKYFREEKKIEEIDEKLPDALFAVSSLPKSSTLEKIFRVIEEGEFGVLSKEAKKSSKQIHENVRYELVLQDFYKRNPSPMVSRTINMIFEMIQTNSIDKISFLADDILSFFQIKREQSNAFAMQKYTLMLGTILVPVILKVALGLMESLNTQSKFSEYVPPYLVIYASIASVAISYNEGKKSMAAIYLFLFCAISLATFYLVV